MQNLLHAFGEVRSAPIVQDLDVVDAKAPGNELVSILDSIADLTAATAAVVLQRGPLTGAPLQIARSVCDGERIGRSVAHAAFLPAPGKLRWIESGAADGEQVLIFGLLSAAAGADPTALMLTFDGAVDRTAIERTVPAMATMLVAHLSLDAQLQRSQRQRRAAVAALQQNECGIIVINADRSVMLCNEAAEAILAAEDVVSLRGNTLRLANYRDAVRFNTAVDCVIDGAALPAGRRSGGIVMLLSRPRGSRPLIAAITPATPSDSGDAAVIVYLLNPDRAVAHGLDSICAAHGLSPVESRLVTHLLDGSTVSEAATDMRIKTSTARGYLKQVFAKTGSHRQVDLIQLFTRYLRAVRGNFDFEAG